MSYIAKNTAYDYANFYNYNLNCQELYRLYMPIISGNATKLFLHLCSDISNKANFKFTQRLITDLLNTLNLTEIEFEDARKNLEAVGLLKTYVTKNNASIVFDIFQPLKFVDFINNQKLKEILIKKVGKKEFEFIETTFTYNQIPSFFNDISTDIDNYYQSMVDDILEFNFEKLYGNLSKTTSINVNIDKKVQSLINNYFVSKMYTFEQIESFIYKAIVKDNVIDEFVISYDILVQLFATNSKDRIHKDFNKIIKVNRHNDLFLKSCSLSSINQAFKDYSSFSSDQYLYLITNTELDSNDLQIINTLRTEYKLNDMLINMMIDYSLDKTHHVLNLKYLRKIAKSFMIKNIISLDEAYQHLLNWGKKEFKAKNSTKNIKEVENELNQETNEVNIEFSSEETQENSVDNTELINSIDWSLFD